MMRVLIAIEESECSNHALQSVMERHWPDDSEFRIINVQEPYHDYDSVNCSASTVATIAQAERDLYAGKRRQLHSHMEALEKALGSRSVSGEVLTGDVRDTILKEAKKWEADLIVMGSHGRRGFAKLFLGSVSEGVAGNADCSVEIVKPKQV